MTISIVRRMLYALPLVILLVGCDVAPAAPNTTTGPVRQPTTVMISEPIPGAATAYPAPNAVPDTPTPYPAPTTSP